MVIVLLLFAGTFISCSEREATSTTTFEKLILILSIILFIISIGSMKKHREKNQDAAMEFSIKGKILLSSLTLLPFIMLVVSMNTLLDLRWYWSLIISVVVTILFMNIFTTLYISKFGYKRKMDKIILDLGGYPNLHIIDALITFALGVILYIVFSAIAYNPYPNYNELSEDYTTEGVVNESNFDTHEEYIEEERKYYEDIEDDDENYDEEDD